MGGFWVKRNAMSRAPNRWAWIDTEAREVDDHGRRIQTWRLGVSHFDWLDEKRRRWHDDGPHRHDTPASLWDAVDGFTRAGGRTIVHAHNMGYDVRIAQAIPELQQRGWRLVRWQVSDRGCVLRWRRDGRALWLCDSGSWLPAELGHIGGLVDIAKPELPRDDDDQADWWARCEADVAILRAAYLPLVRWVRERDLGNWQPTAGSMAWANWRHRHYTHPVLVHDDQDARDAERSAGYTGRCEAWRHGRLGAAAWAEWDFPLAYPRVCLATDLPCILRGRMIAPSARQVTSELPERRVLAHCRIDTAEPVLPFRQGGRILWPVGTFEGWYWDTELRLARAHGATIAPDTAYRYSAAPALAAWASWVIDCVESTDARYTAVQRLFVKAMARALIGRFGVRYWAWEDWGDSDVDGVRMDWLVDADTLDVGRMLHVGGSLFGATALVEGVSSVPAVMSAIMAESRVRLWRAIQVAGVENVAYCDTDSVIVNQAGSDALGAEVDAGGLWGMRRKSTWRNLQVLAPRQLILDGHHRAAGVSKGAQRISDTEWVGERWESLTQAAEANRPGEVVIQPTRWQLEGTDHRRTHLPHGRTAPISVSLSVDPTRGV